MSPVVTLTTDFGLEDPFVGIMKGVILKIAPTTQLIDICHRIEPQNITQGLYVLRAAFPWFPSKTIHLVVVDPGVGGNRRPIAVKTRTAIFVGPDNGILTPALESAITVYELTRERYFLKPVSATFHGRDIFAPVAGWIAKGTPLSRMGKKITHPVKLDLPEPEIKNNQVQGAIIYIDHFGNLITNITEEQLKTISPFPKPVEIKIWKQKIVGPVSAYSDKKRGENGFLLNSWGHVEIFCREGNAARRLKCAVGTPVILQPGS